MCQRCKHRTAEILERLGAFRDISTIIEKGNAAHVLRAALLLWFGACAFLIPGWRFGNVQYTAEKNNESGWFGATGMLYS